MTLLLISLGALRGLLKPATGGQPARLITDAECGLLCCLVQALLPANFKSVTVKGLNLLIVKKFSIHTTRHRGNYHLHTWLHDEVVLERTCILQHCEYNPRILCTF